jgi:hypothetical protein
MSLENKLSDISESQLLESLGTQPTIENSDLSSTRISNQQTESSNNPDRRKTIIPDSHKPKNKQSLAMTDNENDLSLRQKKLSEKDNQNKSGEGKTVHFDIDEDTDETYIKDLNISTNVNLISLEETIDGVDNSNSLNKVKTIEHIDRKQDIDNNTVENDEDNFDTFILQNFVPYSGKENVISWLDLTEEKFKQNRIGRHLRFAAISLLVEGVAKRKYITCRREIQTYDDFYEFLLTEFENTDDTLNSSKSYQTINNRSSVLTGSNSMKVASESKKSSLDNSKTLDLTNYVPLLSSTSVANLDVTDSVGDKSVITTSTVSGSLSNSTLDSTLNDLRKAIVGDLIKNPKIFRGGKEDVNKWIEDIEHLFDLAHIPESTRLDLISYSLRGDALEWFKNNRTLFNSWSIFVVELKRAFTSSYHGEVAFKKLESYSQGENQSIRNFFNEVLKLCKEADPSMSEATKLKNLLSKSKPSIQFEIRKKKPTSTKEFLEFAKEAEELLQLSNMSTDTVTNQTSTQLVQSPQTSSFPSIQPSSSIRSFQNPSYSNSSSNFRNFDKNNRFTQNRNTYSNRNSSSFSNNRIPNPQSGFNNTFSQSYRRPFSNDFVSKNNKNGQPSRNESSNSLRVPQRSANAIDLPSPSQNIETSPDTLTSSCTQCAQFGHETSVCPNF